MQKTPVFARNLRFLRQIRGDTQKDIADLLQKLTPQTITHLESGRNGMSVVDMMILCDYYQIGETEFCRSELWRMTDSEIETLRRRWSDTTIKHSVGMIM